MTPRADLTPEAPALKVLEIVLLLVSIGTGLLSARSLQVVNLLSDSVKSLDGRIGRVEGLMMERGNAPPVLQSPHRRRDYEPD